MRRRRLIVSGTSCSSLTVSTSDPSFLFFSLFYPILPPLLKCFSLTGFVSAALGEEEEVAAGTCSGTSGIHDCFPRS